MKKLMMFLLCGMLLVSLCACGGQDTTASTPGDTAQTVADTTAPETTAPDTAAPETTVPETTEDMLALVRSYIDRPIEELYAVIGQPTASDYAPSCLGDGDDGMLYYDGFIVYTYREGDVETVYDVE